MTAVGHVGHGDELAAYLDLSALGAVVVEVAVGRSRGTAIPPRGCAADRGRG